MPPSDPFVDVVAWPMLPPRLSVGAFSNCSACPSELRRACMKLHESLDTVSSSQAFMERRNTSWRGSGRGQYPLFALTRGPLFAQARGPGRYQPSVLTLGTDGSCPPLRAPPTSGGGIFACGGGCATAPLRSQVLPLRGCRDGCDGVDGAILGCRSPPLLGGSAVQPLYCRFVIINGFRMKIKWFPNENQRFSYSPGHLFSFVRAHSSVRHSFFGRCVRCVGSSPLVGSSGHTVRSVIHSPVVAFGVSGRPHTAVSTHLVHTVSTHSGEASCINSTKHTVSTHLVTITWRDLLLV